MPLDSIENILVQRDGISREEAVALVNDARADLHARLAMGEQPFDICGEWFGLEPDYIDQLV